MVGPPWIAVLGSGPRVDADNRSHTNPLTGKPDAGDPPVRFGGRGSGKPLSLPLSLSLAKDSGPPLAPSFRVAKPARKVTFNLAFPIGASLGGLDGNARDTWSKRNLKILPSACGRMTTW